MKPSLKDLLELDDPTRRPSVALARNVLAEVLQLDPSTARDPESILDSYFDDGYTPSFDEITLWVREIGSDPSYGEYERAVVKIYSGLQDSTHPKVVGFQSALDRYSKGELNNEALILEVADLFVSLDHSPIWAGTAADRFWHVAKVQSAIYRHSKVNCGVIDAEFDLLQELQALQISQLEDMRDGKESTVDLSKVIANYATKMSIVDNAREELTALGIRLGFLYRDAWWIEKHAEVTLQGYLAKQTSQKAGEGGGRKSSIARLQRIRYFMAEHAKLIAQNPILREDPKEEVAHRALKLAIKANPAAFKIGRSKKVAVEYWEYIRSDPELRQEYKMLLKT